MNGESILVCRKCNGTGYIVLSSGYKKTILGNEIETSMKMMCPECKGSGFAKLKKNILK